MFQVSCKVQYGKGSSLLLCDSFGGVYEYLWFTQAAVKNTAVTTSSGAVQNVGS